MSEALLGFLAYVTDRVVTTQAPMLVVDLYRHAERESIDALRCLGFVHVLRHSVQRNVTWVWPTREACRRLGKPELVTQVAELLKHLQTDVTQHRFPDLSVARAAAAANRDASATALSMLLLNDTASAVIGPRAGDSFNLYVYDIPAFLAFDADSLSSTGTERAHVKTAAELQLRYADGEREFAVVMANEQDFRGAVLDNVQIDHGSFRSSDFRGSSFRGARLGKYPPTGIRVGTNLVFGLDFAAADFGDAGFEGADLRGADLTDARIDGARFDDGTQISEASLSRARWDVVLRNGRVVRRGQWTSDAQEVIRVEPGFSLVPDRTYATWSVRKGSDTIKTLDDSTGIRLCALLAANASRSIHALDAAAALDSRPPALGGLAPLNYADGDVSELLSEFGSRAVFDAKPEVEQRLRACLRELDRLEGVARTALRKQMAAELRHNRLNLTGLTQVQNVVSKLRKRGIRGLRALAGEALQPFVAAFEFGEFCSYNRHASPQSALSK